MATAHKVAGMFGRRDPMRRYMDKITALADNLGVSYHLPNLLCLYWNSILISYRCAIT